jgi:hypothetical protein
MTDNNNNRAKMQARKRAKRRESEYKSRLKLLSKTGIYSPKSDTLTPYRKSRINKAWRDYSQYFPTPGKGEKFHRPDKFFFVDATKGQSKGRVKKFLANAKSMGMVTTPKGVFIEREGQRRAKVEYSNKRHEFDIVLTGKIKWGKNKGKRISDRIPVAPLDRVSGEEQRIRDMAEAFGPLSEKERLSFLLYENNVEVGAHRATYNNIEHLMEAINRYHRENQSARLKFFRLVTLRKTTMLDWSREHPNTKNLASNRKRSARRKVDKYGRPK